MTEEIKKILDEMINSNDYEDYKIYGKRLIEIGRLLLDYITNLQQKYEISQKDIQSLKNNYNDLVKISENKITNLQQDLDKANDIIEKDRQFYKCRMDEYIDLKKENEELKQTLHNITINGVEEENTTVLDLIKENKRLNQNNQSYQEEMTRTWKIADDYESRCKKANKFIDNSSHYYSTIKHGEGFSIDLDEEVFCNTLLNILNGSEGNE